jgi:hypothetical protein
MIIVFYLKEAKKKVISINTSSELLNETVSFCDSMGSQGGEISEGIYPTLMELF